MAVRQVGPVPVLKERAVHQAVTLLKETPKADLLGAGSLPWRSHWLPIGAHPVGSLHIHGRATAGGALTGLSAKVYVSNVAKDGAGKLIATVTADDVVPWGVASTHPAAQFAQVVIEGLDDGMSVGIEAHLATQSGA